MSSKPVVDPRTIPASLGPWQPCVACEKLHKGNNEEIACLKAHVLGPAMVARVKATLADATPRRLEATLREILLHVGEK